MNEKRFTIITSIILGVILLAGGGLIYYLQFDVKVKKEEERDQVRKAVADAQEKQAKIPVLLKQIEALEKQEKEKIQQIPNLDKAEYDVFANLLDDLRRQAGVDVARASWATPSRPAPVPGRPARTQPASVHKVQYDLAVTGSFYQLLRYVNLIEQQRRFIGVEDFSITKAGGDAPITGARAVAPKRDLKISIYSYTYKLPPQPPLIEAEEIRTGVSTDIPD